MNDDEYVSEADHRTGDAGTALLCLYDEALPQVYGYLLRRTGRRELAEDLTSETFLAAAGAARAAPATPVTVGWLIGVARHKLVDHWRRREREQRSLAAVADSLGADVAAEGGDDPWPGVLDALVAQRALDSLQPQHRAALILRYVDDLPVAQVAELLGRSVQATEALLVRSRRHFRDNYGRDDDDEEGSRD